MRIGDVEIGAGQPCRFVAEMSNNHNGDLARALRLIDAAKWAGADFIKMQCFVPSELVALRGDGPAPEPWGSQGFTMSTLYERARTPHEWFPELFGHARALGLTPFSSVFGMDSLAVLEAVECPAYKIASLDNTKTAVRYAARLTGKPVFVSAADATIRNRLDTWLYCPAGYPASGFTVPVFPHSGYIGLSSHCLDPAVPLAAVARGCKLIEMHFQLDDEPSELEANVSLTATQFRAMVDGVRGVERYLP